MAGARKSRRSIAVETPPELRWPFGPQTTGLMLIGAAALVALALSFPDGALNAPLRGLLRGLFGQAAFLTPLLLVGLGLAAWLPKFVSHHRFDRAGIVSWIVIWTGLSALIQMSTGRPQPMWDGDGGGLIGWSLSSTLESLFGITSTGFLLVATTAVATCVAFGIGPRDFARTARSLLKLIKSRPRPQHASVAISPADSANARRAGVLRIPVPQLRRVTVETPPRTPYVMNAKIESDSSLPPTPVWGTGGWRMPPMELLNPGIAGELTQADFEKKARAIEEALADFDVHASVVEIHPGPTVTQFGLRPGFRERRDRHGNVTRRDKIKVSEITNLANDLALAMAAPSIRIEAPVPGRQLVGLEVPNGVSGVVALRDLLESDKFKRLSAKAKLAVALGMDVSGNVVCADLAKMPHLLVAGATGSGKSVCVNSIIASLLLHASPDELKLLMVDPKRVELTGYNDIPHLLRPVVTEADKVVSVLRWVTHEMDERYKSFERVGCRNLDGYARARLTRTELPAIPYLVVIIDELADIMLMAAEEIEPALCRLAQMARATGIHLVVATQRPSVDVITGLIKANFPTRISFAVTSQVDSRTILDSVGAEKLLGRGDMLYLAGDAPKPARLQGTYVSDTEIEAVVEHWRTQGKPNYVEDLVNVAAWTGDETEENDLYDRALEVARQHNRISTSLLQRRLRIGYPRAARLVETLEERGIVGPADGAKSREVLLNEKTGDGTDSTDGELAVGRFGGG